MEGVMDLSVAGRDKHRAARAPGGLATTWHSDLPGVAVTLENAALWREFHELGTEMIITKSGRRMFPSLQLRVRGLDPAASYAVLLDAVPASPRRHRFGGGAWGEAGGSELHLAPAPPRVYVHPDSPAAGARWMAEPVSLHRAKITNNPADQSGHIMLMSMHKYLPRVMVARTADVRSALWSPVHVCSFPETEFIAVTAYQNKKITNLKINKNPFARGFREGGQSNSKRKCNKEHITDPVDGDDEARRRRCSEPSSEHSADDSGCVSAGSCSPATDDGRTPACLPLACPSRELWRSPCCPPLLLLPPLPLLPPPQTPFLAWSDHALNLALDAKGCCAFPSS
ncbi:T-box transcription factor mls-1-like [Bacillus rossius redtenbacheri]|uniref:T-box transcription factor mls-1-like n=1 Tax=Bacillus rossius redtenbacheri TaxID=93214 RepID=UPI002FDE633D